MSNKSFEDKKQIYKNSKLYYTTQITEYDKWQIDEIDDRSQKLAAEALKIWQLPQQYQKTKAVPLSLHTLYEDKAQFTNTKPSLFLIGDKEFSVNNWSDILPILCKTLDKEDHETFIKIAKPDRIAAFGIEDETHPYSENTSFFHIIDNVYIRQFMSAMGILNTIAKISTSYDELAGTEYADNILFALK